MKATIPTSKNYDVNSIKNALMSYTIEDRWNKNSNYTNGFNSAAQNLINAVATSNCGFPSQVANTIIMNGFRFISEKQSSVIAQFCAETSNQEVIDALTQQVGCLIFEKTRNSYRAEAEAAARAHKKDQIKSERKATGISKAEYRRRYDELNLLYKSGDKSAKEEMKKIQRFAF